MLPGTKTITGTPQYMAPEVMLTQPQGMKVDIYSAAIIMWEILTGSIPWRGLDIVQIIHQVTPHAHKAPNPHRESLGPSKRLTTTRHVSKSQPRAQNPDHQT